MEMQLLEKLEKYPELKKHVKEMLDIVEDTNNTLKRADDAEIKVVGNMRKIGSIVLQEWAFNQEKAIKDEWKKENINSKKHGKKKSIGKPLLEE